MFFNNFENPHGFLILTSARATQTCPPLCSNSLKLPGQRTLKVSSHPLERGIKSQRKRNLMGKSKCGERDGERRREKNREDEVKVVKREK